MNDEAVAGSTADVSALLEASGEIIPPFQVLLASPGLAPLVSAAGRHLRAHATVSARDRYVVVLSVAHSSHAAYTWASHLPLARDAGVPESVIEAISQDRRAEHPDPDVPALAEFVRQLFETNRVDGQLREDLRRRHDERWLVEITAIVGQVFYLAAVANVFEIAAGATSRKEL